MTEKEFKALIDKYLAGEATEEEVRLVDAFMDVQASRAGKMKSEHSEVMWASIAAKIEAEKEGSEPDATSVRWSRLHKALVACSILVLLAISAFFVHRTISKHLKVPVEWTTVTSAKGQKSLITLGDGSHIYLNAESSVKYPETFEDDRREIVLSGEAFFEVTRDERRPFIVRTENMTTRVLGTSFNIESFEESAAKVTVVTGRVQVSSNDKHTNLVVEPHHQAILDGESDFVLRKVDVAPYIAWKNRVLYFEDNTLEEVVAELERWYNVRITLQDDGIRYCKINGQYKDIELRSVLKSIQYMYQIEYKFQDQNNIVLYGKGCH